MELSISAAVVAIQTCQLPSRTSNEEAENHDCIKPGVGWREKGFTVSGLRSKTKILKEDVVVSLHNPTDVSESVPK